MTALQGQGLLDAAAATGDPKLVRLVERVRALLAEIRDGLAAAEAQREVRAKVARLEAELASARAELSEGPQRGHGHGVPVPAGSRRRAAWARMTAYRLTPVGPEGGEP